MYIYMWMEETGTIDWVATAFTLVGMTANVFPNPSEAERGPMHKLSDSHALDEYSSNLYVPPEQSSS